MEHNLIIQIENALSEVYKSIHQKSYQSHAKMKLYPGQPRLLGLIYENEGITQKELAEKNFVKPATITGMLNKLEQNNYVYRIADENDRRIMKVYLTPEGKHLAEEGRKAMKCMTKKMFDGFTEEELQTYLSLLLKIKHNLTDE